MRNALLAILFLFVAACRPAPENDPRLVAEWMRALYGTVRAERLSPPVVSRLLSYASVALHEGLAAGTSGPPSLAGTLNGLTDLPRGETGTSYDGSLVALAAETVVLDSLLREALPTTRATLTALADSMAAARMEQGISGLLRARSESLGTRIGLALVAWSHTDGYAAARGRPYAAPVGPGLWLNDSPGTTYASQNLSGATEFIALDNPANTLRPGAASDRSLILNRPKQPGLRDLAPVNMAGTTEPYWGTIRPFMLKRWDQCPLEAPPGYSAEAGSPLYLQAKEVYDTSKALTDATRATALYWADNPGETGTPAGHWIAIASQMIGRLGLDANAAARLFVVAAVAQADAFIATWGYKFKYNLIRPRTYIRRVLDPAWEPLIPTPPFPEYPSGHSALSAAAATGITALIGAQTFDDSTGLSLGPVPRRFTSFMEAAEQAGLSRVLGGIHFQVGNLGGRALGICIGDATARGLPVGNRP
jgi:membrane-associated phospholipid phosphatase